MYPRRLRQWMCARDFRAAENSSECERCAKSLRDATFSSAASWSSDHSVEFDDRKRRAPRYCQTAMGDLPAWFVLWADVRLDAINLQLTPCAPPLVACSSRAVSMALCQQQLPGNRTCVLLQRLCGGALSANQFGSVSHKSTSPDHFNDRLRCSTFTRWPVTAAKPELKYGA